MASPRFKLNQEDGKKILKGLLIAVAGAALTYAAELLPSIDFGQYTPLAVAVFSALINALRKLLANK